MEQDNKPEQKSKIVGFLINDVWVTGQQYANVNLYDDNDVTEICAWDVVGIFSDKDLAIKACVTKMHFIFLAPINVDLAKGDIDFEVFYPLDK